MSQNSIIAIVPARGGSKGVPRKNVRLLGGKPLLQHTAEAAFRSRALRRVVLSTDVSEIAEAGKKCGLEVPLLRPAELARDDTPMKDVVRHLLTTQLADWEVQPELVVLLQPTAPFRTAAHIDEALGLLESSGAGSVVSVVRVPTHFHPDWQLVLQENSRLSLHNGHSLKDIITRRQSLGTTFVRNGAIYAFRRTAFLAEGSLYPEPCVGYEMSWEDSLNIDTEADFLEAERRMENRSHRVT